MEIGRQDGGGGGMDVVGVKSAGKSFICSFSKEVVRGKDRQSNVLKGQMTVNMRIQNQVFSKFKVTPIKCGTMKELISLKRKKRKMQGRRRNFKLAVAARMQCRTSQAHHQRRKRLRRRMKEISEEQRQIKLRQKKVREKAEAIELECEELRKETILITQQTANTQILLALMFQILKARQNQELDKATLLTHALRELIERGNQQRKL